MRRLLYNMIFPLMVLVASCDKKTEFEGVRPDQRLAGLLSEYEAQLTGASHGWLGYLFPEGGGGYTFKFTFNAENRVVMYADMNEGYAATPKESSYRLKATQVPSLYFDTYSYLHELSDPDPAKSGGAVGAGLVSDFEFSILSASADTIRLKGNLNGSELLLIRATENQGDNYIAQAYTYNQEIEKLNGFRYYYNKFSVGGSEYNFTINTAKNTVSFYSTKDGFTRFTTEYASLHNGLVLRTPFVDDGVEIGSLTDFNINSTAHTATVLAGGQSAAITNEPAPLVTDPEAATRMYVEPYQYASDSGFTVGGMPDGQHLSDITGYVGLSYIPRQYVDGYDAFFVFWNEGYNYVGPALNTLIDADGKMYFHNIVSYGNNGLNDLTEQDVELINGFVAQLLDTSGYYVYQTGSRYYDLVSVANPEIWIRFY